VSIAREWRVGVSKSDGIWRTCRSILPATTTMEAVPVPVGLVFAVSDSSLDGGGGGDGGRARKRSTVRGRFAGMHSTLRKVLRTVIRTPCRVVPTHHVYQYPERNDTQDMQRLIDDWVYHTECRLGYQIVLLRMPHIPHEHRSSGVR